MSKFYCCRGCDSKADHIGHPPGNGDWPEEMPHRKKGGKKRERAKSDHKHIYTWVEKHPKYWWADRDYYTLWDGRRFTYEYKVCCEWTCQKVVKSRMKYI